MENYNKTLESIIAKKKADAGDNFTVLYRTDSGSSELQYSEYFLDQLETRQGKELDEEKEIDIRVNPITWELFLERDYFTIGEHPIDYRKILMPQTNIMQIERVTREIQQTYEKLEALRAELQGRNEVANRGEHFYGGDADREYKLSMVADIPSLLKDSFNIVNYPKWGEYVEFDYNKLKAEMLDEFIKTGSKDALDTKYNTLLHIMEKFPNKFNLKSEKIIEVTAEKPYELINEEIMKIRRENELTNTPYYHEILDKIREIRLRKPENPENMDDNDQVAAWRISLESWRNELKEFYNTITEEYKQIQTINLILSSHINLS